MTLEGVYICMRVARSICEDPSFCRRRLQEEKLNLMPPVPLKRAEENRVADCSCVEQDEMRGYHWFNPSSELPVGLL